MGNLSPKIEGAAIVLIGKFNPGIIQPTWLSANDLIRREEAEEASTTGLEVISQGVTSFSLEWARIQVLPEKFVAESVSSAQALELMALVAGIFGLLEHTPMSMMGFIWRAHYELPSADDWHAFGDLVAPKEHWCDVLSSPIRDGTPGLRELVIEGQRESSTAAWTRVKVAPSIRAQHGIYVEIHEEYNEVERGGEASSVLLDILRDDWEQFLREASGMAEKILSWKEEE